MRALWSARAVVLGSRSSGLGKVVQEPRAGFKVAKWRVFYHLARLQSHPTRLKKVYSDKTSRGHAENSDIKTSAMISLHQGLQKRNLF